MTGVREAPAWLDRRAYPFTQRWASLSSGHMHYVDEGQGSPILFVHGTPTWSFEYRHLIRALSRDHRCVAPDHLGFGLSDRPAHFPFTPEAHATTLLEFADLLGLDNLTLVVHDFGGPIGLPLCLDRSSRVARVVVFNSWMWPFDDDGGMRRRAAIAAGPAGRWLYRYGNFSLKGLMPSAYGHRRALTPAIHRQYLEVFRDGPARVRVLHTLARALLGSSTFYTTLLDRAARLRDRPVLIVWGMKDSASRPYLLDRWTSIVPTATVIRLDTAGHWPHEEQPDAVARALTG